MILDNRRITIREVADDVGISLGLCQAIYMDILDMKSAAVKFVPKLLILRKKRHRLDISQEMLMTFTKIQI